MLDDETVTLMTSLVMKPRRPSSALGAVIWTLLTRRRHSHIIDFHLDNLMLADDSQPLHHGPSSSDTRVHLAVICLHLSRSPLFCS